jgi:hypothetical protein
MLHVTSKMHSNYYQYLGCKEMKAKYKRIGKVVVALVIGFWLLSLIPFNKNIKQEVSANIYENGVVADKTIIFIEGEKSNYLFRNDNSFSGKFHILSYEKTGREDMQAGIKWGYEQNIQRLLYYQNASFPDMDVIGTILINDEMTQLALTLKDGTVIATSDEIYTLYTNHVSYNPENDSTFVEGIVPKI